MKKILLSCFLFSIFIIAKGQKPVPEKHFSKNVIYGGIAGIPERGSIETGYTLGFEGFFYGKSQFPLNIDMGVMYVPEYLIIYGLFGVRLQGKPSNAVFYFSPKAGFGFTLGDHSGPAFDLGAAFGIVIHRHLNIGIKELLSLSIINGDIRTISPVQIVLGYEF